MINSHEPVIRIRSDVICGGQEEDSALLRIYSIGSKTDRIAHIKFASVLEAETAQNQEVMRFAINHLEGMKFTENLNYVRDYGKTEMA